MLPASSHAAGVAARRASPARRMLRAACSSALTVCPQPRQENTAWLARFSAAVCPQASQRSEVCRGSTTITTRPASSALARRIDTNWPQPASWMLRFRPVLAAAPLGRNPPGWSGSGRGDGRRTRRMVMEVAALVGDLAVAGRHRLPGTLAIVRTSLLAGQDLLGTTQLGGGDPPVATAGHLSAVGGGGEAGDPDVDADRGPVWFKGAGGHLGIGQDQHPAAPFAANLDRLDPTLDLAVDGDLHVPDPLQIDPTGVGLPTAAVTVPGPLDTVEPARRPEPWIAGRLARSCPPEEPGEGPVQTAQRRLLGRKRPRRHIRPDLPNLLELRRLVPVEDSGVLQPPRVPSFLQPGVVQLTVR